MNLDEYLAKEGFVSENPTCLHCHSPRFFHDLCAKHTEDLLVNIRKTNLLLCNNETNEDVGWFLRVALESTGLERKLDDLHKAIRLFNGDGLNTRQVANAVGVGEEYVNGVLGNN